MAIIGSNVAVHVDYASCASEVRVTVAGKPGDDLAPGTLNSILKQSGMKK